MKANSQRGISLIEVLLSVALIGSIVLVINNVPTSIRLIGSTQKESLASDIVSKEIEQLRALTYGNLSNGTIAIQDPRLTSLPQSSGNAVITNCAAPICNNNENAKQVMVSVTWNDDGQIKKVQVSTIISEGGLK